MIAAIKVEEINITKDERRTIGRILRQYPTFQKIVNSEIQYMFPSLVAQYGSERVNSGALPSSTTESYGIKRADMRRLVEAVEFYLATLLPIERKVIELVYFDGISNGYERLGLSYRSFQRVKQSALDKGVCVFFTI